MVQNDLVVDTLKSNDLNVFIDEDKLIFKNDLSKEDEEKISNKAVELLEFLSGKDSSHIREILENITIDDVKQLENSSSLLMTKFGKLDSIESDQTQSISRSLTKLNEELVEINPYKFDFSKNNFLSSMPFIGKPINRYLKKFQNSKDVINETLSHIEDGEQVLRQDNAILQDDKEYYKNRAISLQKKAIVFEKIIKAIEQNLLKLEPKEREFYENNVLLNLNKKTRSIYEILAVTQQGLLSSDFIINTNWELIDNISNVKLVTKRAIEIGVALAVSLENQKNVIQTAEKTKTLANEILLENAKRMNSQAVDVYEMSSSGTLDIEVLKQAFTQIDEAMSKMDSLKSEALKKVKNEVKALKEVTLKLDEKIKNSQKNEAIKESFLMDM